MATPDCGGWSAAGPRRRPRAPGRGRPRARPRARGRSARRCCRDDSGRSDEFLVGEPEIGLADRHQHVAVFAAGPDAERVVGIVGRALAVAALGIHQHGVDDERVALPFPPRTPGASRHIGARRGASSMMPSPLGVGTGAGAAGFCGRPRARPKSRTSPAARDRRGSVEAGDEGLQPRAPLAKGSRRRSSSPSASRS